MMAATLAEGTTILKNAAREPEIVNLAEVLIGMGARIHGAGSDVITIEGVESLHPAEAEVIPDRIEAGTFLIAAGITGGDIRIIGCVPLHLDALIAKLRDAGMSIDTAEDASGQKAAASCGAWTSRPFPIRVFRPICRPRSWP